MLITDQHTYPSLAPPRLIPVPLPVGYLGCQPIRLGTAHRRSRCTQGSRETDESTLRPEAEKRSFCPLSISLRKSEAALREGRSVEAPLGRGALLLLTASPRPISRAEG